MFCPFLSSEAVEPSQSSGVQRPPRSLLLPRSLTSHHWSHLFWVPTSVFVLSDLAFLADVEDCQSDRDFHLRSSSQGPGGAGHGSLSKTFSMQPFFVLFPCGGLKPLCLFMSLYVSLCLLSIFTASSRFGSSGCWISCFDFPGDEGDQARKNRSRLLRKL